MFESSIAAKYGTSNIILLHFMDHMSQKGSQIREEWKNRPTALNGKMS